MNDTTPTHCGHDPRYIVQASEGTAYCALCELEAARQTVSNMTGTANRYLDSDNNLLWPCPCKACTMAREIVRWVELQSIEPSRSAVQS